MTSAQTMLELADSIEISISHIGDAIISGDRWQMIITALRYSAGATNALSSATPSVSTAEVREQIAKIVCCPNGCILCDTDRGCIALSPEYDHIKIAYLILDALPHQPPAHQVADPTGHPPAANRASKGIDASTGEAPVASVPTVSRPDRCGGGK